MNALLANQNVSASLGKIDIENIRGKTNTNKKARKIKNLKRYIF
jgi:hypothetical protein